MSPDFAQDYLPLTEVVDWMTTLESKTAFKRKNILEQIRRAIKKKKMHLLYLLFYNYCQHRVDPDCGVLYKYQLNRTDF